MKKEILTLIIGILIGAVITVSIFIVLKKTVNPGVPNGTPPSSFERGQFEGGGPRGDEDKLNGKSNKDSEDKSNSELNNDSQEEDSKKE